MEGGGNGRRLHITHVKLCLPFFSPCVAHVYLKKYQHADELRLMFDADAAKSRLMVISACVNSSIDWKLQGRRLLTKWFT